MATIEDIRINGQQSSNSLNPYVAGLSFLLTWEYVDDAVSTSQQYYEIKINSTNSNWDNPELFTGNIVESVESITANFFEYKDHGLTRGGRYYGLLRAVDVDANATDWVKFQFTVNSLPSAINYSLTPSGPDVSQDIELEYTFFDGDGHDESGTKIRWYNNNIYKPDHDDLTILPSSETQVNDSWTARITPSDGLEFGATVETAAVVVTSLDVTIDEVSILPTDANVDDILYADYDITETEYFSITGSVSFAWYKNDTLVASATQQYARIDSEAGDEVYVIVSVVDNDIAIAQKMSETITIQDSSWHTSNLVVDSLSDPIGINNLTPTVEWDLYKSTANFNEKPNYLRFLVTKTPSIEGPVYDTGYVQYTHSYHQIPSGILKKGQNYFFHVGVGDSASFDGDSYNSVEVLITGSSWEELVSNNTGWTIECRVRVDSTNSPSEEANMGIYIHDGSKFCTIVLGVTKITFISDESEEIELDESQYLSSFRTIKISGKGGDAKVFLNSKLVLDGTGKLSSESKLKTVEYGDIDGKNTNVGIFSSFKYSTTAAYGIDDNAPNKDAFFFSTIGKAEGGSIDYIYDDILAWTPHDVTKSSKLIQFNESGKEIKLPTVNKNNSPITSIVLDANRNKYIGTANGVNAVYGEKHDADYSLITDDEDVVISPEDFDRITTITSDQLNLVESDTRPGWFTINTTQDTVATTDFSNPLPSGQDPNDPYFEPYLYPIVSNVIHYYSQRQHGHAWYDKVDNGKGWSANFVFDLDRIEHSNISEADEDPLGFGVYVNDGTYQEIIYFYEDRIRLYYANVYVLINMKSPRNIWITGKGKNIKVYQKLQNASVGSYQLVIDGSGLFTAPATPAGNSRKPKIVLDGFGIYHAVWHDDGNRRSQIMYSYYDGTSWSVPEVITVSTKFKLLNPSIDVDNQGRAWVAYEDKSWDNVEISVSVKDDAGWHPKTRITNHGSLKGSPCIRVDTDDNVHLVWEDNRHGHWEIYSATWNNEAQKWNSSGQFGEDAIVMTFNSSDPYQTDHVVDFRNPQLSLLYPRMWVVAEARLENNKSIIYRGHKDLLTDRWNASGSPSYNSDGEIVGFFLGQAVSRGDRVGTNPSIAASPTKDLFVVAWEDETDSISQIYGSAFSTLNVELTGPTQITERLEDCKNPSVGWANNQAIIAFETSEDIRSCFFNSSNHSFYGSANPGEKDRVLVSSGQLSYHPYVPPFNMSSRTKILYDYISGDEDPYTTTESGQFQLIGEIDVTHEESAPLSALTETSVNSLGTVSNLDTKEFAFGDFSESVGIFAHWKDIALYFGYDSRPYSISTYNSSTVSQWPDDRVNDLFVDIYGNIVAATFGGLIYHNTTTGESVVIEDTSDIIKNQTVTSVKWGKNGIWYVGSTVGGSFSNNAGVTWNSIPSLAGKTINHIAVNKRGEGVFVATDGIYVVKPDDSGMAELLNTISVEYTPKTVAVDDNDILWVATDSGLIRIENYDSETALLFNINNGMRSSHVNEVAIVNNNLRYIATATGVERMNGTSFVNFHVKTTPILNDNIATLKYDSINNSLWVASLSSLHEIVFRDPAHDIIENEVSHYTKSDLLTEDFVDMKKFFILDVDKISDISSDIEISSDSATVYVNKNPITFGYTVDANGIVSFIPDMLKDDQVEILLSSKFKDYHSFEQSNIEVQVRGKKRTTVEKLDKTNLKIGTEDQLVVLTGTDKNQILLYGGNVNLPFTTVMLDRDLPLGCLEQTETLTRSQLKFKIYAQDSHSGISGYMLSNYENFTSDGVTPLTFLPLVSDTVTHDIGSGTTNVSDVLEFPSTTIVDAQTVSVGYGSALASWINPDTSAEYLYAGTSEPCIIFKYDPGEDEWSSVARLDPGNSSRKINRMASVNNVIFIATGSDTNSAVGRIYKSNNGSTFTSVGAVSGQHALSIAGTSDGKVYFGDDAGNVYRYIPEENALQIAYQNVGSAVYSLDIYGNLLIAATGDQGRVYLINLETDDVSIIFDGAESKINDVHIKDRLSTASLEEVQFYIASGDYTTIYRSNIVDFEFVKSYNSVGKTVHRLGSASESVLTERSGSDGDVPSSASKVVAAIGSSLFKHRVPSWEFVYAHNEEIRDFVQYTSKGVDGIFVISDSKVTKWTPIFSTKKVYLRLRDKAGNLSPLPDSSAECPDDSSTICCTFESGGELFGPVYSINIADLKGFVHEQRILDVDEYGAIQFSYDSPNERAFFGANKIDEEVGMYTSEIFNGSNDLVSWKSISWISSEPAGTSVDVQIRSGASESEIADAEWSDNLTKNTEGVVPITHIANQFLQFRLILTSTTRDVSPYVTAVTIRNITTSATHFFTTNFVLPSTVRKGLITTNTFIPVSADIVFGFDTNNSIDFSSYQVIEPNRLFSTSQEQFGNNLRIGAKLISPAIPAVPAVAEEYSGDAITFSCLINTDYRNTTSVDDNFHFRIGFYNDTNRTQLAYEFFSGNDQTGWYLDSEGATSISNEGVSIQAGDTKTIYFSPLDQVPNDEVYYLVIDAYNTTEDTFELISEEYSYACASCSTIYNPGLKTEYFKTGLGTLSYMPELSGLAPDFTVVEPRIDFKPIYSGVWKQINGEAVSNYTDNFAARFKGKIEIPTGGVYQFSLLSSDGSLLFIDGTAVISHDGTHGLTSKSGSIELTQGLHDIEVQYFEGDGSVAALRLFWTIPGATGEQIIPDKRFSHAVLDPYCDAPDVAPSISNLSFIFELEGGETVKLNM